MNDELEGGQPWPFTDEEAEHPLPSGAMFLPDIEVDPNEVVKMFSQLICLCTPKQAKTVRKIQKEYADEHGITIYQ